MGSLSGIIQRPLVAAAAVAAASVSVDLPDRFSPSKPADTCSGSGQIVSSPSASLSDLHSPLVSHISASKLSNLSFVKKIHVPVPDIKKYAVPSLGADIARSPLSSSIVPTSALQNLYQRADLVNAPKPNAFVISIPTSASGSEEVLYKWHLPDPSATDVSRNPSDCSSAKSRTVVVLLGWLGAKQKHLKRYAEWYASMGFHAITFTFPMSEILSYQVGGKAEQNIELLVNHLADWLEEEIGKNLVFHTFSNTGWLTYGAILEKFQKENPSLVGNIRGCIVDSAPVAAPDPQVWASGFSAAFLKKQSVATKGITSSTASITEVASVPKPAVTEAALLLVLEKFFEVILNLPSVNKRLSDVLDVLSSQQPKCPQLYIYSSADRVIPAGSVESFIEEQRRIGREVRACNFISTPHVDHFRNDPQLYTSQLTRFLEDCVLTCCRSSSS
ncbi:transmembrane protein 53-A [Punica granatum]|uniref:Transmembrane protein 53-A n=2 Tax=Punica granatum TaxID=22663 RepID=A0A6P8C9D9_PUNGR|nr:transmembrane protein 53-A [Punica granatum]XP_031380342.1 transmembrane protein 53-A [Punica granatum]OWM90656.1 hypothetical protein CDL15_Pgr020961 [Punica granatum]PKI69579.1 hypothetical protein CRG98_010027 [Punica granatum]